MSANNYTNSTWIKTGLSWGFFMFITMTFILPYFQGEEIHTRDILVGVVVWSLGGLAFGYSMKLYMDGGAEKQG